VEGYAADTVELGGIATDGGIAMKEAPPVNVSNASPGARSDSSNGNCTYVWEKP